MHVVSHTTPQFFLLISEIASLSFLSFLHRIFVSHTHYPLQPSPGYYGPLIDNIALTNEIFRAAVEVAGGNALFHIVVDTDATAAILINELERLKAGRLTFLPLNRYVFGRFVQFYPLGYPFYVQNSNNHFLFFFIIDLIASLPPLPCTIDSTCRASHIPKAVM